jgi:tetratricopeptide (TPR) repeat protein
MMLFAGQAASAWQDVQPPIVQPSESAKQPTQEPAKDGKTEPVAPPTAVPDVPVAPIAPLAPDAAKPAPAAKAKDSNAFPLPDVAPAVKRLLEEPYLKDSERRALRVRHGIWTAEDVNDDRDVESAALAALTVGALDAPSLQNDKTHATTRARGEIARGEYSKAIERLTPLCEDPKSPSLLAIRLRAEAMTALGKAAEADASLERLVTRMGELTVAESLADADEVAEGVRGLMLRARWRGAPAGASDYKAMLAILQRARETVDKLNWNVALAEAEVLADKDNYADAAAALASALALNPRLGDAWAALGRLSVNGFDIDRAEQIAARLDENLGDFNRISAAPAPAPAPAAEGVPAAIPVGSLAGASVLARARLRQKDPAAAAALIDPIVAKYPGNVELLSLRAGIAAATYDLADVDARLKALDAISFGSAVGHYEVGNVLAEERQYADAARYLEEAAKRAPFWSAPVVELGLLEVQSGRNDQALAALERAAKLDPFNVRIANSLKLISDLRAFATVESDHFIVRYRPGVDEVLAKEMPAVLEKIHARVTGKEPGGIRHEPAAKTVIELMPDHHWFSVRITGMPKLHTIAAATGPLVAMEAPRSGPGHLVGPYDWPRVVQHEYTHTVTLSRTKNRLPHWFTEAAAVYLEDAPRDWATVQLIARTAEEDELFTLEEINLAFVRPKKPTDRQLAYAQGHWMYEYIVERFGAEAPLKLMDAYAVGTKEEQAYVSLLGLSREQFLSDFKVWAKAQLVKWGMQLPEGVPSVDDLLVRHNTLVTSQGGEAADEPTPAMLDAWIVEFPRHPDVLRAMVSAKLQASGEEVTEELVPWLERYAEARPPDPMPHKLLAKYYLDGKGAGKEAAIPHLRFLDRREQHSSSYAMELARLLFAKGETAEAGVMAARAVAVSPYDASVREFAATMALQRKDLDEAERQVRALVTLEPDREIHAKRLEALLRMKAEKK